MNSSIKPDVNFLSLAADGTWTQNDGLNNYTQVEFPSNRVVNPDNPTRFASLVKITSGLTVELRGITVGQASENSVDINNKAHATLDGTFGTDTAEGVGNQIFSVKGGAWAKLSGYLKGSGNRWKADIILDTWSDQCYDGSYLDATQLVHTANRKVRIIKRYFASKLVYQKANTEVLVMASIGNTLYCWAKRIVRAVLRIPVGTKGPSWM